MARFKQAISEYSWAIALTIMAVIAISGTAYIYTSSESDHLANSQNYDCPQCDWNGTTAQMIVEQNRGDREFYCPECGKFLGWQASWDDYPVKGV